MHMDSESSRTAPEMLDAEAAAALLSDGGALSAQSESFEERPAQIALLKKVAETFNRNALGVFEAGTGVGKSYAYLIPAILWAAENRQRVVISTGTINLQQQLCDKDIPAAEKIVGKKIRYMLMKGRQNYVCRRRLQEAAADRELFGGGTEILDSLAAWAERSATGSRSEIPSVPPEAVWSRINSESDACMGGRCPFFSECFVMRMRKEAAQSDLIVVNHHLLFADIESRMHGAGYDGQAVLPPYRRLIFDEAHGIESAATSFFSESFSRFKILRQINLLYRRKRNSEAGFLCALARLSANAEKTAAAPEAVQRIRTDLDALEKAALGLLQGESTMRLCEGTASAFGSVITLSLALSRSVSKFSSFVRQIMEDVDEADKENPAYWETRILLRRLDDIGRVLQNFSAWEEKSGSIFWIQKKRLRDAPHGADGGFYVVFTETPLAVAPMMNSGVFEPMESVVFTSATLRTGGSFGYWMRRTGVELAGRERLIQGEFPSPFPYKKNMLFAVPSDAPLPDDAGFRPFVEDAVVRLIGAASGRTLVLFTSYEQLNGAYNAALPALRDFGGALLRQGDDDSARLLRAFRDDTASVLFATDSFWQGVDVPGESLSQVIIVKLPFTVPSDPVFTARAEAVTRSGGSAFMEMSLPEAVIKFRQGAGRLVRRGSDRGSLVVLDRRIYEKRYGSIFLAGIPECRRLYEPLEKIVDRVSDFL